MTLYSATQIPHILKIMTALTLGLPEHHVRVVAPKVGGAFGSKLNVYAEELLRGAGQEARRTCPVERGSHRERRRHHPGPRPDPGHRAGGRRERPAHRRPGPAAVRHGGVPAARHPWHPVARRLLPLRGRVRPPGCVRLQPHVGVHQHDADGRLSRGWAPGGHLRHRAGHGRAGGQDGAGPDGAAAQLRQVRAVPLHRLQRTGLRLGRPPGRSRQGGRAGRLRRGPGPPADAERARLDQVSASASRATSRCGLAPSRVLASLNYGAGGWETATVRVLRPTRCRSSPGRPRMARATRPAGR